MRIFAVKPGHDGHAAHIVDGFLDFSIESEKDSGLRYSALDIYQALEILHTVEVFPDVIALSGWSAGADPRDRPIGAGYLGVDCVSMRDYSLFGAPLKLFTSSHERSHILCAYAMSPFEQGRCCYALVWEGYIGSFYQIDERVNIEKLGDIMCAPGIRYAFAYAIADPTFNLPSSRIRLGDAGKLMALAAFEQSPTPTAEEQKLLSLLLGNPDSIPQFNKADFEKFEVFNSGVESSPSRRLARLISDGIYHFFEANIRRLIREKRPLLISGGCGLNCDWNRALLDSGLFDDTFVPPCPNDSGSAIGTGVDAQFFLTGNAKLGWNAYAGAEFVDDVGVKDAARLGPFFRHEMNLRTIAMELEAGAIIAWVSGRTEIGPRALGNRSILAAPFEKQTLLRLNQIKQRETFRPIAPVCLEEDASLYFDLTQSSPFMLYFSRVRNPALQAVTHVDGSSRVQTVNESQNPQITCLLKAFKERTGFSVLCNTSLNFHGDGFINRTSDLVRYAERTGLDGFVADGQFFDRHPPAPRKAP